MHGAVGEQSLSWSSLASQPPPLRHTHSDLPSDKTCWHNMWCKAAQSSLYIFKTFCFIKEQHLVFNIIFFSKEVHSAWRFRVLKLETQKAGGGKMSLLCRTAAVPTSTPHRQGPQPQSLSCLFFFLLFLTFWFYKKKWLEKGCIKNTIHSFYF